VKFWDTRRGHSPVASIAASATDVNVLSWNARRAFLVASGADDGAFVVWDIRKLVDSGEAVAQFQFQWHRGPITSIEWNPHEASGLAVASEDDTVSIWDFSLKPEQTQVDGQDIPAQLMFVHQGQQGVKEAHFHRQIPGLLLSTAETGFNVFKPNNLQAAT
jgi:ribosome assembly protein RRB1